MCTLGAVADAGVGSVRIGELGRRTGVSPELLRAWERRYGLLEPSRSSGGFRLYSARDEDRVRTMVALIASGLSASEAAARALSTAGETDAPSDEPLTGDLASELTDAMDRFDSQRANAAIDRLLASVSFEAALELVLIPYLQELGDRWERGEVSVAQEHFASNLVRGRLLGIARDWALGAGPVYVLACPPGEEHDLALIMFGIAISRRGARVVFLGADTPIETIEDAVRATDPAAAVLSAARPELFTDVAASIRALGERVAVWICGRGANAEVAEAIGARLVEGDPVTAARSIS